MCYCTESAFGRDHWRLSSPAPYTERSARACCSVSCLVRLWISPRIETTQTPREACFSIWPFTIIKKKAFKVWMEFHVFDFVPIVLTLFTGYCWEDSLPSLLSLSGVYTDCSDPTKPSLSQAENLSSFLSVFLYVACSNPWIIFMFLH